MPSRSQPILIDHFLKFKTFCQHKNTTKSMNQYKIDMSLQRAVGLHQSGRLSEAIAIYEAILAHNKDQPHALHLSGVLFSQKGEHDQALLRLKQALLLLPNDPGVSSNLALAFKRLGRFREAARYYEQALALDPTFQQARLGIIQTCLILGDEAHGQNRRNEALSWYQHCLKYDPGHSLCLNNMAIIFQQMGRIDEALGCFKQALKVSGNTSFIHSNYLLGLHYSPKTTQNVYFNEAIVFGEDKPPDATPLITTSIGKNRPLRLGYISGDFCGHAVSTFILPLLEAHDPAQSSTVLFSNAPLSRKASQKLNAMDLKVHDIHDQDDQQTLDLLRDEKLDLLIDLSGHMARNRLPVLARRAAPVQATWLGYFNTTGVAAINYLLADERCCPTGTENLYTESIMRLPDSFFCYTPPEVDIPAKAPPCLAGAPFTFGCFNETHKLNEELIQTWVEILHRTPETRLLIKAKGFADNDVVQRYLCLFETRGIAPDRLILEGPSPPASYLASYHKVDLCLDTFPYNGGTVTCDALWMGVPVLCLAGQLMVSRMGLSLLHAAGLREWICYTHEEYILQAANLAVRPAILADMRTGLRQKMLSSPLCDRRKFITDLMNAYHIMIER